MDLIFKIAAIGVLISILNVVLNKSGREDIAMLSTLAGMTVVLLLVAKQISDLFQTIKTMFRF